MKRIIYLFMLLTSYFIFKIILKIIKPITWSRLFGIPGSLPTLSEGSTLFLTDSLYRTGINQDNYKRKESWKVQATDSKDDQRWECTNATGLVTVYCTG